MISIALVSLAWAVVVVALLVAGHLRDRRHDELVQSLCQRVQAPDVAVAQHLQADTPSLGYVPVDDDELMAEEFRVLNGA